MANKDDDDNRMDDFDANDDDDLEYLIPKPRASIFDFGSGRT